MLRYLYSGRSPFVFWLTPHGLARIKIPQRCLGEFEEMWDSPLDSLCFFHARENRFAIFLGWGP